MADINQATPRPTLGQEAYSLIESAIISGSLEPGQRINTDELASQYGISRIPVREALRALEATGWVSIKPRHGVYVRTRTRAQAQDLFEVRELVEPTAARLASTRRSSGQLEALSLNIEAYSAAIEAENPGASEINASFHELIAEASGNEFLGEIIRSIGKRVEWYFASVVVQRGPESVAEHRRLLAAVERRDGDAAAELMGIHVRSTLALLEKGLDDQSTAVSQ